MNAALVNNQMLSQSSRLPFILALLLTFCLFGRKFDHLINRGPGSNTHLSLANLVSMWYSYQIGFYGQTLQTRKRLRRESSHRHLRNVPLSDKASFIYAHTPNECRSLIRLNSIHKDHTRIQNGHVWACTSKSVHAFRNEMSFSVVEQIRHIERFRRVV